MDNVYNYDSYTDKTSLAAKFEWNIVINVHKSRNLSD
jgi:hypothetical protein